MPFPVSDIPPDSWILVTGASGFIATHVIQNLLGRGYKVRGTVRNVSSTDSLFKEHFGSYLDQDRLQIIKVPDFTADGAFDNALMEVAGIVAIIAIADWHPDPDIVVTPTVGALLPLLKATRKAPRLRSFVFTSTIMAAVTPALGNEIHVERDTWNTAAVDAAWMPPPYEPSRAIMTYTAAKVASEQKLWEFVEKERPSFRVNVVSPSGAIGSPLHVKHIDNPSTWIPKIFREEMQALNMFPSGEQPLSTSLNVQLMTCSLLCGR
jgi:nucleoside-diphosphate-sugar epimerase